MWNEGIYAIYNFHTSYNYDSIKLYFQPTNGQLHLWNTDTSGLTFVKLFIEGKKIVSLNMLFPLSFMSFPPPIKKEFAKQW